MKIFLDIVKGLWFQTDSVLIGHNLLGFDWPVLHAAIQFRGEVHSPQYLDTLILSKLIDDSRKGHSVRLWSRV